MNKEKIGASEVTPEIIIWTRQRLGINQRIMAKRLGCYQKSISHWETGAKKPNKFYRALIAVIHNAIIDGETMENPNGS